MDGSNFHLASNRNLKWLAASLGAAMLFFPAKGVAQSQRKTDSKKETAKTVSLATQPDLASQKRQAAIISSNENGRITFADYRTKPVSAALSSDAKSSSAPQTKTIRIWDACDPESFDHAVKPGTCIPGHHGQTKFEDFIGELDLDQIAGGWRFNPLLNTSDGAFKLIQLQLEPGDRISLQNVGGETHTFTKVAEYGGGFFDPLNGRTGNPTPAPECARVLPDGTLAPQPESDTNQFVEAATTEAGPLAGTPVLPLGVTRWQCCIHPWMRINVVVRDHSHEHDHSQQQ